MDLAYYKKSLEKSSLGFDPYKKLTSKESNSFKNITCFHCNRNGHYRSACPLKRVIHRNNLLRPVKLIWIPKGTSSLYNIVTDTHGSKNIWVPKSKINFVPAGVS